MSRKWKVTQQGMDCVSKKQWKNTLINFLDINEMVEYETLKHVPLCRNIKKSRRNCQNQICQNFGKWSKVYNNQTNVESRKIQIKSGRKGLWCFCLSLPSCLPGSAALSRRVAMFTMGPLSLVPGTVEQILFVNDCSNPSGDHLKDWCKALNLEKTQDSTAVGIGKNTVR